MSLHTSRCTSKLGEGRVHWSDDLRRVVTTVELDTYERIRRIAREERLPIAFIVRRMLRERLDALETT